MGGGRYLLTLLICTQYCPSFCMSELTLLDATQNSTVKHLDRCSRGNSMCKYMLFLVQISMQMHNADPALLASFTIFSGFDADGALYSTAGKGHTVVTDSENGNSSIHCTGTLPDGAALPQGAHHSDNASTGSLCNAAFGIGSASTSDWKAVTTPNGKYTLTCHYRQ